MTSLPFDPRLIVTTDTLPAHQILATLGLVEGYQPFLGVALTSAGQRQKMSDVLSGATQDMMRRAAALGANAVVGLRYVVLGDGGMLVYGTAVSVRPLSSDWNQPSIGQ